MPAGHYDVWVSRGPEWTAQVIHDLVIGPQGRRACRHDAEDTSSTPRGFLSGDFHVHAASSPDSQVPMQDRIYEFCSDGVELIVSTDHNIVADYAPVITQLGAGRYIASLPGDEMTTGGWGHFGAFPLERDLERAGQGAVLVHGRTAADFFADVRRVAPLAIIDVHHPRIDDEIGYFNLTPLRSPAPTEAAAAGLLVRLRRAGGAERVSRRRAKARRQGDRRLVRAARSRSPRHRDGKLRHAPPRPQHRRIPAQLHRGGRRRSTAPHARAGGRRPPRAPQLLHDGAVRPRHRRQARATETSCASARDERCREGPHRGAGRALGHRVARDGVPRRARADSRIAVPASTRGDPARRWTSTCRSTRDDYLVVRVDGDRPLAPIVGDLIRFDVRPMALTNPIFFDVDGNGRFDAPQKRH